MPQKYEKFYARIIIYNKALLHRIFRQTCLNTYNSFGVYLVVSIEINAKCSNFHKILIVNHWIFRKLSYLCTKIEAFFAYCKIQKRAEVRSFPYCYLYYVGKCPTS